MNVALDASSSGGQARREGWLRLQRVPLDRPACVRTLYWRARRGGDACATGALIDSTGALFVPHGTTISFDTYFGGFFETGWHLYTLARGLQLSMRLQGRALIQVWRRQQGGVVTLLHEQVGEGDVEVALRPNVSHFRQAGLVWFELTALEDPITLREAGWWIEPGESQPIGLGVVICTFDRAAALGPVLDGIAGDDALRDAVTRVIVVNQGGAGLRTHPAIRSAATGLSERLKIVEQPNFGGAGGFGRGLIEALDDPAVTHVCFLDDDVQLEPESLLRMAAFFAIVRQTDGHDAVTLGGHMLDGLNQTTLYEAGAVVLPNGALQPLNHLLDLREAEGLEPLLDVTPMHYNGWWMFGFDKRLVARVGMPLPCFIRGDDVEWGLRLHNLGVATVPMPGVGIWHEPFYLKIGGWQLYYETRNALIAMALHGDFLPGRLRSLMLKRLLTYLLTYRYHSAALVVRAMEDFLAGPAILDRDPRPLHAGLAAMRVAYPDRTTPREQVVEPVQVRRPPRFRAGFVIDLAAAVWRNWLRPSTPGGMVRRLEVQDLVWFRVIGADSLAVDTWWDRHLLTLRRDRAAFRTLLSSGLRATLQLAQGAPALQAAWKLHAARLTTVAFWRDYLVRR